MSVDGNRIMRKLKTHALFLDFRHQNLGDDLCGAFTDGTMRSILAEESASGAGWPALSPKYEEWKSRRFPGQQMGHLYGLMTDPAQIRGEIEVHRDSAQTTYGITEEARNEAAWFQRGDAGQNRPPRPFWGFTPSSRAAVRRILATRFRRMVKK